MVVVEFKDAMREKAFELVDEIKELDRESKMVVCELEDTLYDCFENESKDDEEQSEEGKDLGFKSKYNRHYAMRNFNDEHDEDMPEHTYRHGMRMRRRLNRYA